MSDSTYNERFFRERAAQANLDAQLLVPDIVSALGRYPRTVIDFGCGDGAFLRWFREAGAEVTIGIDQHGPDDWARHKGLHLRLDLTEPIDLERKADLVVCLEVAEHLPESAADTLVSTLTRHGDRILFSSAPPGQGGTGHLNEQPRGYWEEKFWRHGYAFQDLFRHRLHGAVSPWYRQNMFLVAEAGHRITIPTAKITMARYRDSFFEVDDEIARLRYDPETLTADGKIVRLIRDTYRSTPVGFHELAYSAVVDKMRSQLASETIDRPEWATCEVSMWIDADQIFRAQQVIDLLVALKENNWDVATGAYTTKQERARVVHRPLEDSGAIQFGPFAIPVKVAGIGFGFVAMRNQMLRRLVADPRANVERTWYHEGTFVWDMFRPELGKAGDDWIDPVTGHACAPYYNEDFSFCERLRRCGIDIWMVPSIFVKHRGRRDFGFENLAHAMVGR
jgi:SAM-dependent methyltransferase